MKTKIEIENWNRNKLYSFFKDFEEPMFGVCVNVDCTKVFYASKENKRSLFLAYLHKSLIAVNSIQAFKYRIEDEEVFVYDKIHASTTILKPDNTFGFADIEYTEDYVVFEKEAKEIINSVHNSKELHSNKFGQAVIHYSAVPWVHFTSMSHARKYSIKCSCPKISFGKILNVNERIIMPVSIHGHHALMDGITIGEYIDLFQTKLDNL